MKKLNEAYTTFKDKSLTAISAAFGFLIALSWREPISDAINLMIAKLGLLNANAVYYKFISAIMITAVSVLILMLIAKFTTKEEKINGIGNL